VLEAARARQLAGRLHIRVPQSCSGGHRRYVGTLFCGLGLHSQSS
jgi:hypothetical protein